MRTFLVILSGVVVLVTGFTLTLVFQALIPTHPEMKDTLIWASIASLVVGCVGPIAIAMADSYRVHGSLRPALWTMARVLIIGVIWSAITNRNDETER